jgi:hypothetical protein
VRGFEDTDELVATVLGELWAAGDEVPQCVPFVYGFPWSWDVEGYVRVTEGPPVAVQVEAAIAACPQTPELLAELNALTAAARWVRFYCYPGDDVVYVSYALLADAVTPLSLSAAVDWVRYAADQFGPLLALVSAQPGR